MEIENLMLLSGVILLLTTIFLILQKGFQIKIQIYYILWGMITACFTIPMIILISYQVEGAYQYRYVYEHIDNTLPIWYRISALWAGQQGSLLLWTVILCIGGFCILAYYKKNKYILSIYSAILLAIAVMTYLTKPFEVMVTRSNGLGLSQALQDPWMVVHPPLVFVSYTGMAILFSIASLVESHEKLMRGWLRFSFLFLGAGIMTGSVWAYRSLGWGGFWAWDAIENIAFVPWLIMCAFLHGGIKITKVKCVIPFLIAAFGTFMTRSGILQDKSVHAYTDGNYETAIICFGAIVLSAILCTIIILIKRKKTVEEKKEFNPFTLFRLITYLYAALIFAVTLVSIFVEISNTAVFYNGLTIGYVLCLLGLFIWLEGGISYWEFIACLAITTFTTIFVSVHFHVLNVFLLVLFWATVYVTSQYIIRFKKLRNNHYRICHLFLLLFILGIIASTSFSNEYIQQGYVKDGSVVLKERKIKKEVLDSEKTHIIHMITEDYIINEVSGMEGENVMIRYTSKPLIPLLWIGSFGMLGTMSIHPILNAVKRKRSEQKEKS